MKMATEEKRMYEQDLKMHNEIDAIAEVYEICSSEADYIWCHSENPTEAAEIAVKYAEAVENGEIRKDIIWNIAEEAVKEEEDNYCDFEIELRKALYAAKAAEKLIKEKELSDAEAEEIWKAREEAENRFLGSYEGERKFFWTVRDNNTCTYINCRYCPIDTITGASNAEQEGKNWLRYEKELSLQQIREAEATLMEIRSEIELRIKEGHGVKRLFSKADKIIISYQKHALNQERYFLYTQLKRGMLSVYDCICIEWAEYLKAVRDMQEEINIICDLEKVA